MKIAVQKDLGFPKFSTLHQIQKRLTMYQKSYHYDGCGQATPHDENFEKKPAYYGTEQAVIEL